ncbi:MAG TPA: HD domain-containing phosphohydrolase [Phycisphaerales bacterium]|nr:HD domain-containing phosphohydrolase [Phycisphaerales bacterium]
MSTSDPVTSQQLHLSGGFGRAANSARSGYLPIPLTRVPIAALKNLPLYVRVRHTPDDKAAFRLYRAPEITFTDSDRQRLIAGGTQFLYIQMADQSRFRQQTVECLTDLASDPSTAVAARSAIIYKTSIELVNELLAEPDLAAKAPRLEVVSKSITALVINDQNAFSHLFAASHHDFYTATHMVNVATWMTTLAYAMGRRSTDELNLICQAGLLHDIGKLYIPEDLLNKKGKLEDREWAVIREHPVRGCEHLAKFEGIDPLTFTVTRQHHERMDGTGYPDGLKGDQIHPVSRICAVVDSFDAMTAFRPFKTRTFTVEQAMEVLESETPAKYDPEVFAAWKALLESAPPEADVSPSAEAPAAGGGAERRQFQRYPLHTPARVHPLAAGSGRWNEMPAIQAVTHSISRAGLGFLSPSPIQIGEFVRLYLSTPADKNFMGQIVRSRSYRDGWFEVGLCFSQLPAMGQAA